MIRTYFVRQKAVILSFASVAIESPKPRTPEQPPRNCPKVPWNAEIVLPPTLYSQYTQALQSTS